MLEHSDDYDTFIFGMTIGSKKYDYYAEMFGLSVTPLGHDFNAGITENVTVIENATCIKQGKIQIKCSRCDAVTEQLTDYAAHTPESFGAKEAVNCLTEGFCAGTRCTVCLQTIVEPKSIGYGAHQNLTTINYKTATCKENGYTGDSFCFDCNKIAKEGNVIHKEDVAHIYTEATIKNATCTQDGTIAYHCSVCNNSYTETIPAKGHIDENGDGRCDRCNTIINPVEEDDSNIPKDALRYNGHYYKLFDSGTSWKDAKKQCENMGGHLVTITSQGEQDFIISMLSGITKGTVWLGGFRNNGKFYWITGEAWAYENWNIGEGEPSGDGNYVQMISKLNGYHNLTIGAWNDRSGGLIVGDFWADCAFICEWEKPEGYIYSLAISGLSEHESFGTNYDVTSFWSALTSNSLYGYQAKKNNQHIYFYDSASYIGSEQADNNIQVINSRIESYFCNTTDSDITFIYYSGHGCHNSGGKSVGFAVGETYDQYCIAYEWTDFANELAENIKGDIVVILDCCFSEGFYTEGVSKLSEDQKARFHVLCSCSETEESNIKRFGNIFRNVTYGCFTYHLLNGIGFFDEQQYADSSNNGNG